MSPHLLVVALAKPSAPEKVLYPFPKSPLVYSTSHLPYLIASIAIGFPLVGPEVVGRVANKPTHLSFVPGLPVVLSTVAVFGSITYGTHESNARVLLPP